jgi:inhibitor of cysteine peptidase
MRDSRRLALFLAAAFLAAAGLIFGCAPTPPQAPTAVRVDESATGTSVSLHVGQTLEVSLAGNITTGFDWALAGTLPSQLTTVSDGYKTDPASAGAAGAGGTRTFVYRAVVSGSGTLKLSYGRPWEAGVAPAKTFSLTVTVP